MDCEFSLYSEPFQLFTFHVKMFNVDQRYQLQQLWSVWVCLYILACLCAYACFFFLVDMSVSVRSALWAGGSERLRPFNTAVIRGGHIHTQQVRQSSSL